jgi:hypothetical protein
MTSTETNEQPTLKGEDISPEKDGGLFGILI